MRMHRPYTLHTARMVDRPIMARQEEEEEEVEEEEKEGVDRGVEMVAEEEEVEVGMGRVEGKRLDGMNRSISARPRRT